QRADLFPGLSLVDLHVSVHAAQGQPLAIVAESRARNPRDVSVARGEGRAGGRLPALHHPVHAHGGEALAARTEAHSVACQGLLMLGVSADFLTGADIPEPHRAVHARRAQALAVRAKGEPYDAVGVTREGAERFAGRRVPNLYLAIRMGACGQVPPV